MKLKKKHIKWILCLLVIAILIGAACYTVLGKRNEEKETNSEIETKVVSGNFAQGITESGSIEFITNSLDYDLTFPFFEEEEEDEDEEEEEESGYLRVEEVYVANGQRIKTGDAILKLTEKSINSLRTKIETAKSDAEIALEEAKTASDIETLNAKQTYDSSTLEEGSAETLYLLTTQSLQKEIEQEQAKIEVWNLEVQQIEKTLEDSYDSFMDLEEEYEDLKKEYEKTDQMASIANYVTMRDQYVEKRETYEKTKEERLEQRDKIVDIKEDIENQQLVIGQLQQKLERKVLDAKQSYEDSTLSGALAGEIYQYSVDALLETADNAAEELAEIESALAAFETFVGDGTIYAKEDGLITDIAYEKEEYIKTLGALVTYACEGNYTITVDISEEDIPNIAVGEEVKIEFSAYPQEDYTGVVTKVTPKASENYETMVSYPVTIEVKDEAQKLFGGMTGAVTFQANEASEVWNVSEKN